MSLPDTLQVLEYDRGVLAIDTGFMRDCMAAAWLIESGDGVAFIETGLNASVPRLLRVLELRGWTVDDVRYIIPTHVHLDHAGGAGTLMAACPGAELLVHPRGARHLVDPTRLEASVRQVYGDEFYDATYGALVPVPADRVREMADGDHVLLGHRRLDFIDTPGHAAHHFCVWDAESRGWFTGDTFGLSFRELDTPRGPFVFPSTTPIQFDPLALKQSVDRLMAADPQWMYLTHFGRVGDLSRLAEDMKTAVDALVDIALRHRDSDHRTDAIQDEMYAWLRARAGDHGVKLAEQALHDILWPDVVINTQGLEFWLDHPR